MLPKRTSRSANLPRRQSTRPQIGRQLIALNHPIAWSGAAVLLLSGLFLTEYWQPQPAENSSSSSAASARRNNPLLQGSSNSADNAGGLPDLPLPVLSDEAASRSAAPVDSDLRSLTQPPQNRSQSNSRPAQPARPANDPALSLYNPMGIPLPRAWEDLSNPAQLSGSEQPAANPTANPTANPAANPPAISPLQSALDRMRLPVNPQSNLPQSTQAPDAVQGNPMSGNLGNSIPQTGAIAPGTMGIGQPNPTIPQPSYAPMPQTTGYTMPPAFRTPGNSSPYSSPNSAPTASPIATPAMPPTLPLTPAPMPQSNFGQETQNSSSGAIGGREVNSFSNP